MRHAPEGRDCEKGCWRWVVKGGVGTWAKAADAVAATAAARRQVAGVNSSSLALAPSDAEAGAMPLSAPVAGVSVGDAVGTAVGVGVGVARALSCAAAVLTAAAAASHAINGVTTATAEAAVTVVVAVPVAAAGVGPWTGLGGWPLLAVAPGVCVPFAASSTAAAAGGSADVDCEPAAAALTNRRSNWLPDAVCVFSVSAPGAAAPTVDGSTTGARTAAEARVRTSGAE